jgi:hypothetical protein
MKLLSLAVPLALVLASTEASRGADAPESPSAAVEITCRTVGEVALPPTWEILLRTAAQPAESISRYPAKAGEPLRLQLPVGSSWEVSADLPGFWVPRKTLTVGRAEEISRLDLYLWPLGRISGRITVEQKKDVSPPREMLVKTVAAPALLKRPPMPPGVLNCPVDEAGNWSCSLPAATFDLVVTAEGFTPHYRWGVTVPPAKTLPLGPFQLSRGGSVAAWVAVEEGTIDPARAVARLSFLAACDSDAKAALELDRVAVERPVSKEGFLQITGLAPGSYALEVRQPGLAPARVANVVVALQSETFLPEPLLLTRPIALEFEIKPPLDEQGEPWRAQVVRRIEGSSLPAPFVYDGPADEVGRFTVPEQSPGWFRVAVLDSRGNRIHAEPELELDASAKHTIEVRRIAVEGRLKLGSKALAGTLWFGGQHGTKRVKMEADDKGRFAGFLSTDGFWVVDVEAADPKFQARTRTEVRPDRNGKATVAIELPDTRVFGRIVDQHGRPALQALLWITTEGLDQNVPADGAGTFDVRGLPEGLLALIATDGGSGAGQSERTLVDAHQESHIGPLELRLRPIRRLQGTVSSSLGPIAGARIVALANSPFVGGGQATTGPEGAFSLEIPANIASLTAVVKAPGFGTQAFPIIPDEKTIALTLSEAAGEIAVALPRAAEDLQRESFRVAFFQNGLEIPISVLREDAVSARASGTDSAPVLRLANLAPGQYSACIAPKQVDSKGSLEHAPKAAGACDTGHLATGAKLALTLHSEN